MRRPPLHRKLLYALVPTVFVLVNAAALGEWWLRRQQPGAFDQRVLQPSPLSDPAHPHRRCYAEHPTVGYAPRPGTCGRDDRGLRVHEPGLPGDPLKVLVVGDSIADQDEWVAVLQDQLEVELQRPVLALNSGVPGFDTCSEVALMEARAQAADVDLVLLQLCLNDFEVSAAVLPLGDGQVRLHAGSTYELPAWVLRSRLALWAAMRWGWGLVGEGQRRSTEPIDSCLDHLVDLSKEEGFIVATAVFPAFVSDPSSMDVVVEGRRATAGAAEDHALALMELRGVPAWNLRAWLQARGPLENQRNAPHDVWHPDTPAQHAIGRSLAPVLADLLR